VGKGPVWAGRQAAFRGLAQLGNQTLIMSIDPAVDKPGGICFDLDNDLSVSDFRSISISDRLRFWELKNIRKEIKAPTGGDLTLKRQLSVLVYRDQRCGSRRNSPFLSGWKH